MVESELPMIVRIRRCDAQICNPRIDQAGGFLAVTLSTMVEIGIIIQCLALFPKVRRADKLTYFPKKRENRKVHYAVVTN
jgi:hypothetical protein